MRVGMIVVGVLGLGWPALAASKVTLESPGAVERFGVAEFAVRVGSPPFTNPFVQAKLTARFLAPGGKPIEVHGFADSADGSLFRVRFCPSLGPARYRYAIRLDGAGLSERFEGELESLSSKGRGPVVVSAEHPRHFVWLADGEPFYHLGYTAYHLLDISNDDQQIEATIRYCADHGFNKIRFLLTGYPRDTDGRTSGDVEFGVVEQAKRAPNYGALPGQVNALPAWPGSPHGYDFTRFNVGYWQRVDQAVRRMRASGIVATCIFTIEKQDLPGEYGRLSEAEYRLYAYAVARLAAFDNVWWDLGNEHNEFRNTAWGDTMGRFVKEQDPYDRLTSAHAYSVFFYTNSPWADFIITQQYGDEKAVHDWVLNDLRVAKPYVNEEYGYEFNADQPGHGMKADWVRRCHWSIALAGGYATYGDWSRGVAWYYMGDPGPGIAAVQLVHLRRFFESLPFIRMDPHDELVTTGFCLAVPGEVYALYLPRGGETTLDLRPGTGSFELTWFDPRTGQAAPVTQIDGGEKRLLGAAPFPADVAARIVRRPRSEEKD